MPKFKLPKLPKKFKSTSAVVAVLGILLVAAAFYIGILTTELKYAGSSPAYPTAGDNFAPEVDTNELARDVDRPNDEDHIRGNRDAKVALIEYSDYECPFCRQFHPSMKQIISEMGDSVMWVYRHWPIDQIHPMARPAAVAGECVAQLAGEDAFWNFTDTVFENQDLLSLSQIDEWALAAGINSPQYETCKTSDEAAVAVELDVESGNNAGVTGTPGNIVINLETGEVVVLPGAVPTEQVKAAIQSLQ